MDVYANALWLVPGNKHLVSEYLSKPKKQAYFSPHENNDSCNDSETEENNYYSILNCHGRNCMKCDIRIFTLWN